jgi:predicted O-methyltransferase YrrM
MKTLTQQLFELAKGIIEEKPEVSDHTGHFTMADDGGVETQTGTFLYGLLNILQPELVLETGTYTGVSAMYMGQALKDNGHGHIITLEISPVHKERAERLWVQTGVSPFVTCQQVASLEYQTSSQFDFIFLDSEPEFRFKELVKFYPNLKPGGYIFIHDLHRHLSQQDNKEHGFGWPYGKLPEEIVNWIAEDKLRCFSFPTPRGLTGFYKPTEEDYRV